jgi:hypothetical protein
VLQHGLAASKSPTAFLLVTAIELSSEAPGCTSGRPGPGPVSGGQTRVQGVARQARVLVQGVISRSWSRVLQGLRARGWSYPYLISYALFALQRLQGGLAFLRPHFLPCGEGLNGLAVDANIIGVLDASALSQLNY